MTEKLINTINSINVKLSLNKNDKSYLHDKLLLLEDRTSKEETKLLEPIIEVLEKVRLNKNDRKQIIEEKKSLIKIINKYEEVFEEEDNDETVDEKMNEDDVEKLLDDKIHKYNKYDKNHPMEGISFNKVNNKYRIQYKNIQTETKNLETACQKVMNNFDSKNSEKISKNPEKISKNPEKILENITKNKFLYQDHYFLIYWNNNKPYFDIQHIISILNLKQSYIKEKYNEFSHNICYYIWHKNEFNGYILRELIAEETMYSIIFSSNSKLSKSFKKDVSKILSQLRKQGDLQLTNKTITLKKNKFINMKEDVSSVLTTNYHHICSYLNPIDLEYLEMLIIEGSKIPISRYIKKHTLYGFVIPLKTEHNDIIIKFGYSEDIIKRIITLRNEYKSDIFLIKLKQITGQNDEETFHSALKTKYPHLIEKQIIDEKEKTELYKLSDIMINCFDQYMNNEIPADEPKNLTSEEKQIIESVKYQEKKFIHKFNKILLNNNLVDNRSIYDYLIIKENNKHNQEIKNKELEILKENNKHQLEVNKHQLEVNKHQLEIIKEIKNIDVEKLKLMNQYFDNNNLNNKSYVSEESDDNKQKKMNKIIKQEEILF